MGLLYLLGERGRGGWFKMLYLSPDKSDHYIDPTLRKVHAAASVWIKLTPLDLDSVFCVDLVCKEELNLLLKVSDF